MAAAACFPAPPSSFVHDGERASEFVRSEERRGQKRKGKTNCPNVFFFAAASLHNECFYDPPPPRLWTELNTSVWKKKGTDISRKNFHQKVRTTATNERYSIPTTVSGASITRITALLCSFIYQGLLITHRGGGSSRGRRGGGGVKLWSKGPLQQSNRVSVMALSASWIIAVSPPPLQGKEEEEEGGTSAEILGSSCPPEALPRENQESQ